MLKQDNRAIATEVKTEGAGDLQMDLHYVKVSPEQLQELEDCIVRRLLDAWASQDRPGSR